MSFAVAADKYDRFIGRYCRELAPQFLEFADVTQGPVLDVGCGPGPFAAAIAARFGPSQLTQSEERRTQLRDACFEQLGHPIGPLVLPATAIAIRGYR